MAIGRPSAGGFDVSVGAESAGGIHPEFRTQRGDGRMTTFVLMHGGGMGGWTWKYVRPLLSQAGHEVFTPTFTGFGERAHLIGREHGNATHVTDIVNVLHYEDLTDVVLVAHSYAGTVAPGVVAEAGHRIRRLVYLD